MSTKQRAQNSLGVSRRILQLVLSGKLAEWLGADGQESSHRGEADILLLRLGLEPKYLELLAQEPIDFLHDCVPASPSAVEARFSRLHRLIVSFGVNVNILCRDCGERGPAMFLLNCAHDTVFKLDFSSAEESAELTEMTGRDVFDCLCTSASVGGEVGARAFARLLKAAKRFVGRVKETWQRDKTLAVACDKAEENFVWAEYVVLFGNTADDPGAVLYHKDQFQARKLPITPRRIAIQSRACPFPGGNLEKEGLWRLISRLLRQGRRTYLVDYADCGVLFCHDSLWPSDLQLTGNQSSLLPSSSFL